MYLHIIVADKLEAWNAFLAADHPDILCVFTVWHSKAIGLALSQTFLSPGTVDIVQPDLTWNEEAQQTHLRWRLGDEWLTLWINPYSADAQTRLIPVHNC